MRLTAGLCCHWNVQRNPIDAVGYFILFKVGCRHAISQWSEKIESSLPIRRNPIQSIPIQSAVMDTKLGRRVRFPPISPFIFSLSFQSIITSIDSAWNSLCNMSVFNFFHVKNSIAIPKMVPVSTHLFFDILLNWVDIFCSNSNEIPFNRFSMKLSID